MILTPCGSKCSSNYCEQCAQREACSGCLESEGKPFYIKDFGLEVCPIYDCAVNKKGYKTCAPCPDLPCKIIYDWRNPSFTEEEHRKIVEMNVERLKKSLSEEQDG